MVSPIRFYLYSTNGKFQAIRKCRIQFRTYNRNMTQSEFPAEWIRADKITYQKWIQTRIQKSKRMWLDYRFCSIQKDFIENIVKFIDSQAQNLCGELIHTNGYRGVMDHGISV